MGRRNSDSGRLAVIWLATTYITLIGAGAAAFTIFALSDKPEGPLMMLGAGLAVVAVLVVLFNIRWEEPMNQLKYWLFAHERQDPTDIYRAARRRIKSREQDYGNNEPPSVESVRDAANHGGAWVPHSSGTERPPKK